MHFIHLLFAFALALLLTTILVLVAGYRTRRKEASAGATFLFFFFIMFPVIWAGGIWLTPFGPSAYGFVWAPFLTIGLVLILLLVAMLPGPDKKLPEDREPRAGEQQIQDDEKAVVLFGASFFILMAMMAIAIIVSYLLIE